MTNFFDLYEEAKVKAFFTKGKMVAKALDNKAELPSADNEEILMKEFSHLIFNFVESQLMDSGVESKDEIIKEFQKFFGIQREEPTQIEVNGKILNRVKATVVRGYITRYIREEEWEDFLIEIPLGCQLVDGDAIPYYLKKEDGKFYEYYGHYAPEGEHAYVSEENFSDFLIKE